MVLPGRHPDVCTSFFGDATGCMMAPKWCHGAFKRLNLLPLRWHQGWRYVGAQESAAFQSGFRARYTAPGKAPAQGHSDGRGSQAGAVSDSLIDVSPVVEELAAFASGAKAEAEADQSAAAFSTWDTSITTPGSKFLNAGTNVTVGEFQAQLGANGYTVVKNTGGTTVLSNGQSTYTIYARTSTGLPGAQYFGPNGTSVKYSLGR